MAEAAPGKLEPDVPEPVTLQEAETASAAFPGFVIHPFPTCFVCGPAASKDVGLRVFPGPVANRGLVAAPWRPPTWLTRAGGGIDPRIVWAVLDCPGGWAVIPEAGPSVLGRMTASLLAPVLPKGRYILLGWARGAEGRKLYAGSALFTQEGALLAAAVATWLRLEHRGSGQ